MVSNNNHNSISLQSFKSSIDNNGDGYNENIANSLLSDENHENNLDSLCEEFKYIDGRMFINLENSCEITAVDEKSLINMEIQEMIYQYLWNGPFSVPIQDQLAHDNMCVLDIGCGSGSWLINMAELYPKSTFVGLDITSFQRSVNLPNLAFIKSNIFDGLPFPDNTFDYVHQGNMLGSIRDNQWQSVIDEIIRVTKPDGWIEFAEREMKTYSTGPIYSKFNKTYLNYLRSLGVNPNICNDLESMLKNTNQLDEIITDYKNAPLGSWGGCVGEIFLKVSIELFTIFAKDYADFSQISPEELKEHRKTLPLDFNKSRVYTKIHRICGRKKKNIQ